MNANRELRMTDDGSVTFFDKEKGESFHSQHGAINESKHVFIRSGLDYLQKQKQINILEIGWGTGLNTLLTFQHNLLNNQKIRYIAFEKFPLQPNEYLSLNYSANHVEIEASFLQNLHKSDWDIPIEVNEYFQFTKILADFTQISLHSNFFNLVYFDAFSPEIQPELWTKEVFQKIYNSCTNEAVFVTYSVKGEVRRRLKEVGFRVEKIPGPFGKREITRAFKD